MREENCIFCKLANGDIPTNTVYEDDTFRVILDASPATKGHALILPKQHYANLDELDEKTAETVLPLAKKMMKKMKKALNYDGFNVLQNNGEVAGQTVFHFHMHLIPRYENAKNKDILQWTHETFTEEEMEQVRAAIEQA